MRFVPVTGDTDKKNDGLDFPGMDAVFPGMDAVFPGFLNVPVLLHWWITKLITPPL